MSADFIPLAADLGAARSQMAFTLSFHIILACIGVGFPAIILVANYLGLRRNDADALRLGSRWACCGRSSCAGSATSSGCPSP